VHDVRVVFPRENISSTAHIRGKLIHLVETVVDYGATYLRVAKIPNEEVVCCGLRELRKLEINSANPVTLRSEAFHQVTADKTTSAENERSLHVMRLLFATLIRIDIIAKREDSATVNRTYYDQKWSVVSILCEITEVPV
jgi:hypothetical protein